LKAESSKSEDPTRLLTDRAAIQDVLLRYARGVDHRDLDLVAACFTPDASYEGALARGTIAEALVRLRDRIARYDSTMHFIGNQLIEVNGDTAKSETYAVAYHRLTERGEARLFSVAVRYLDELVRDGGQWRIRGRVVRAEWQRTEAL
jgi:3-phenylpropionate/cinnamic acid dioxygenase small subunit